MVSTYSDRQLLEQVECVGGIIPNRGKYLIIGMQSASDVFNTFDDKFYVYDGPDFKQVSPGTTNVGKTALLHYDTHNLTGAAVWKTDQWCPNVYKPGYHKGRMKALRQVQPIEYYRDSNKNTLAEEVGELHKGIIYTNMHGIDYDPYSNKTKKIINGWSFGCQVWSNMTDYRQMIRATWARGKAVDYALLKEF